MALWIQNVTTDPLKADIKGEPHDYVVRINNEPPLATFKHDRVFGAAECLRAAANAIDSANGATS